MDGRDLGQGSDVVKIALTETKTRTGLIKTKTKTKTKNKDRGYQDQDRDQDQGDRLKKGVGTDRNKTTCMNCRWKASYWGFETGHREIWTKLHSNIF